ncbi:imidazole glycerol phosphate synthase subunit HisF [Candidatus Epulonipiscioides gigas]|nr:imidazole glycerol phosphate synthase subunit HisF [Epulopiscium sp. SCG-C07WGA-EpuloA2]
MLSKRIIPCLDIRDGRVVKGVNFEGVKDVSDPVALAKFYNDEGADELVFYDITASFEGRKLFTEILEEVASQIFIPLTVGGGINTLEDFDRVLKCGADKVSVNSGAIKNKYLLQDASKKYGSQCVVLSIDAKRVGNEFKVCTMGGRALTDIDLVSWAKEGEALGAGEIVLNSIDTDGVKQGFDIEMLRAVCDVVNIPVVASGGAGGIEDFKILFQTLNKVDAGLAASIFHYKKVKISDLKDYLSENNIEMRKI